MTTTPTATLHTSTGYDPGVERVYDNIQMSIPSVLLSALKVEVWNTVEAFFIQSTLRREHVYWRMASEVYDQNFNPFDESWLVSEVLHVDGLSKFRIIPPAVLRDLTYPTPTVERSGEIWLALKPASFAAVQCGCASDIWSRWFETIVAGVRSRLHAQPAKPYSSPQLAQYYLGAYTRGVQEARDTARRGHVDGGGNWLFPYFAGGRRR